MKTEPPKPSRPGIRIIREGGETAIITLWMIGVLVILLLVFEYGGG